MLIRTVLQGLGVAGALLAAAPAAAQRAPLVGCYAFTARERVFKPPVFPSDTVRLDARRHAVRAGRRVLPLRPPADSLRQQLRDFGPTWRVEADTVRVLVSEIPTVGVEIVLKRTATGLRGWAEPFTDVGGRRAELRQPVEARRVRCAVAAA